MIEELVAQLFLKFPALRSKVLEVQLASDVIDRHIDGVFEHILEKRRRRFRMQGLFPREEYPAVRHFERAKVDRELGQFKDDAIGVDIDGREAGIEWLNCLPASHHISKRSSEFPVSCDRSFN